MMGAFAAGTFLPASYEKQGSCWYAALQLLLSPEAQKKVILPSVSLLEDYYAEKNAITRIRQRSSDLRRIVSTALEGILKNMICS